MMNVQSTTLTDAAHPQRALDHRTEEGLKNAAQGFEMLLIQQVLKEMHRGISGLFGRGNTGEIYKSMFIEGLAEQTAQSGGFGLRPMIYDELKRLALQTVSAAPMEGNSESITPKD